MHFKETHISALFFSMLFLVISIGCESRSSRTGPYPPRPPDGRRGGTHLQIQAWSGPLLLQNRRHYRKLLADHGLCDRAWINLGDAKCQSWDNFSPYLVLQLEGRTLPTRITVILTAFFQGILDWGHYPTGQGSFVMGGEAKTYNSNRGFHARFTQRFGGFGHSLVYPVLLRSESTHPEKNSTLEVTFYYGAIANNDNLMGTATLQNEQTAFGGDRRSRDTEDGLSRRR